MRLQHLVAPSKTNILTHPSSEFLATARLAILDKSDAVAVDSCINSFHILVSTGINKHFKRTGMKQVGAIARVIVLPRA
jgi:hypothetical protein